MVGFALVYFQGKFLVKLSGVFIPEEGDASQQISKIPHSWSSQPRKDPSKDPQPKILLSRHTVLIF